MAFVVTRRRINHTQYIPTSSRIYTHFPIQHYHSTRHRPPAINRIPRYLPILHAPTLNRHQFFYEEQEQEQEQQQQEEEFQLLPEVPAPYHMTITREISVRVPTFAPQQNYPRHQLPRLATQPVRHAEKKYPTHIYLLK